MASAPPLALALALFFLALLCPLARAQPLEPLLTVRVGASPHGLHLSGGTLHVALEGEGAVAVVADFFSSSPNLTRVEVKGTPVDLIPSSFPSGAPSSTVFIVSLYDSGSLVALNVTSGMVEGAWSPCAGPTSFASPSSSSTGEEQGTSGGLFHIPCDASRLLVGFDTASHQLERSYRTGERPSSATVGRRGRTAFIANRGEDSLSLLDLNNGLDTKIPLPQGAAPGGVGLCGENGDLVLVAGTGRDELYLVNALTGALEGTLSGEGIGPQPSAVAVSVGGAYAFVANVGGGTVAVVDVAARKVVQVVPVGSQPVAMWRSASALLVSNRASGTVSAFSITLP